MKLYYDESCISSTLKSSSEKSKTILNIHFNIIYLIWTYMGENYVNVLTCDKIKINIRIIGISRCSFLNKWSVTFMVWRQPSKDTIEPLAFNINI